MDDTMKIGSIKDDIECLKEGNEFICSELKEIADDIRDIKLMLKAQSDSMTNLDQHVSFVNGVYDDFVKSPIDWLRSGSRRVTRAIALN